jgi:predicted nucleic acid-binding Zn ribbon protein
MSGPGFVRLSDVRLGRAADLSGPAGALAVLQAWGRVVAAPMAERARPGQWRDGVLEIVVDEERWKVAVEAMSPVLREELNGWIGEPMVREIRVVDGGR